MTKTEANALNLVVAGFKDKDMKLPASGTDVYLVCSDIRVQFLVGGGAGDCTAISISSAGEVKFILATLYSVNLGAGAEVTFSLGSFKKVQGISKLRDVNAYFFSSDSGYELIVGGRVKHSTFTSKGNTSILDPSFRVGLGLNIVSFEASYISIDDNQREISFMLNQEEKDYLK